MDSRYDRAVEEVRSDHGWGRVAWHQRAGDAYPLFHVARGLTLSLDDILADVHDVRRSSALGHSDAGDLFTA